MNRIRVTGRWSAVCRQVRDPLWFLARQWQLGEFAGEDAGSPVQATMSVQSRPLTGYAPNGSGAPTEDFDRALALEAHVEQVPVVLNVRGSAQLGRRVENAIRASLPPAAADLAMPQLFEESLPGEVVGGDLFGVGAFDGDPGIEGL